MPSFYDQVLNHCEPYLGQATKRFVDRQIVYHLSKTPENLDYSDKEDLAKWIRISASLVLEAAQASELAEKIMLLR